MNFLGLKLLRGCVGRRRDSDSLLGIGEIFESVGLFTYEELSLGSGQSGHEFMRSVAIKSYPT